MFKNLRQFLAHLTEIGELATVSREVSKEHELAAYCHRMIQRRGPAVLFEKVAGFDIPVVAELFAQRRRVAAALGTTVSQLNRTWTERLSKPIPPVMVGTGPCKEVIMHDVDVTSLPNPTWNELDGGPYITFGVVISKDPDTGEVNAGIYRIQVHSKTRIGILFAPYRHVALHRNKRPGKPCPVAIVIGCDPATIIAAATPFAQGVGELDMAGGLRQSPTELVPCETIPLEVPAQAEIVLEGYIHPEDMVEEGPYGEFTGSYSPRAPRHVIDVQCITMRKNPIYVGTHHGMPSQDAHMLQAIPTEAEIMRTVALPGLRDIFIPESACGAFHAIASVERRIVGYPKMMGLSILGTWGGRYIKQLTLVDASIDPRDRDMVDWAVATKVQPHRDIEIITNLVGIAMDPSLPEFERVTRYSRTSKMIIDATGFVDGTPEPVLCTPPKDVLDKVDAQWESDFGGKYK